MDGDASARLANAHQQRPRPLGDRAQISPVRRDGRRLWISGQVAATGDGLVATGRVGAEIDLDLARVCARQCALNVLEQVELAVGLDSVASVLRLTVYVASAPGFTSQHLVADAATDLVTEVLAGPQHVRTAIGVAALPLGSPVEVDAIVLLHDQSAER